MWLLYAASDQVSGIAGESGEASQKPDTRRFVAACYVPVSLPDRGARFFVSDWCLAIHMLIQGIANPIAQVEPDTAKLAQLAKWLL